MSSLSEPAETQIESTLQKPLALKAPELLTQGFIIAKAKKNPRNAEKSDDVVSKTKVTLLTSTKDLNVEKEKESAQMLTPESLGSSSSHQSSAHSALKTPPTANSAVEWRCKECNAKESDTPLKRKGADGKRNLCNACYVRWRVKCEKAERGSARPTAEQIASSAKSAVNPTYHLKSSTYPPAYPSAYPSASPVLMSNPFLSNLGSPILANPVAWNQHLLASQTNGLGIYSPEAYMIPLPIQQNARSAGFMSPFIPSHPNSAYVFQPKNPEFEVDGEYVSPPTAGFTRKRKSSAVELDYAQKR